MPDREQLYMALKKADAAGDVEGAKKLAVYIKGMGIPEQPKQRTWGDVAGEAISNLPASVGRVAGGVIEAVAHPLDTAKGVLDIAAGGLQEILPKSIVDAVNKHDPNSQAGQDARQKAGEVINFYKRRYGSMESVKNAIAEDPAGVMADVSTVLTGGGGVISKLPMAGKVGQAAIQAGKAFDPLALTAKGIGAAARGTGKLASSVLGTTTGAGTEAIKQAVKAGEAGGEQAQQFAGNMRGTSEMADVLQTAKSDLAAMGAQRAEAYRQGMTGISNDKTILSFNGVDDAIKKAMDTVSYKGQVKNQRAAEAVQNMSDAVENWKSLNPAEFHTPEGLDALKQSIGGIMESIPLEEKTARLVAGNIYNSIKNEIAKQAPKYAEVMKDYTQASEQIQEIEKALSLGKKASIDTAMRKLQSLMRNNVQTNYGNRLALAQQLEQAGGGQIMPALAGQSLNSLTPRGLQSATTIPTSLLGYGVGGIPVAAAGLLAGSPRLVGEAALATGRLRGAAKQSAAAVNALANRLGIDPTIAANYLYQANQQGTR